MSLADLELYKVYCCYFNGGNLQVLDMEEDLKITIGHYKLIYIFMKAGLIRYILHHHSLVESTSLKREK